MSTSTCLAYTWELAIDTTTGAITVTIVVMIVADGGHITAADRVGPSRAETVRPTKDRGVRVGGTVKRSGIVDDGGRLRAAFSFGSLEQLLVIAPILFRLALHRRRFRIFDLHPMR